MEKYRKLAIRIGILWLTSALVLFGACYFISSHIALVRNVATVIVFTQYAEILMLVWILVFIPMLFFVQRFARKAQMKQYALISRILFIYQAVCGGLLACWKAIGVIISLMQ